MEDVDDVDDEALGKLKTKTEALLSRGSSIRYAWYQHRYHQILAGVVYLGRTSA